MVPWSTPSPGIRRGERPATYYIGRFGQEIITRSRFVPPGVVESGSYTAFRIAPSEGEFPKKHTSGKSMHVHAWHVHALEVCAVGIRKRACTVTDRTCPETDWPCAPPHKQTSRLYDAINSPPTPLAPTSSGVPTGHGRPHRTPRPS